MNLILEELGLLGSTLQQKITVGERPVIVKHIRPHIYKHGTPAGSLKVQILDGSLTVIAESALVTVASITAISNTYYHGYIQFDVDCGMQANQSYWIRLASTGYTYAANNFIGWCKDFDLKKYDWSYSPNAGGQSSFDVEIWENKNVVKGII